MPTEDTDEACRSKLAITHAPSENTAMTSRRLLAVPPPTDPHDFDAKVADALRLREGNIRLIRYARQGQAQQGIDGWDPLSGPNGGIMWQAKLVQKAQILRSLKHDLRLLDEARFTPELFILATGLARDRKIQDSVAAITNDRKAHGLCPVEVLFWDEIRDLILSDDRLFAKHYSELVVRETNTAKPPDTAAKAPRRRARAPKPSAAQPRPLVANETSKVRTVRHPGHQTLCWLRDLARLCPVLSASEMGEIETWLMMAEHGIEIGKRWTNGCTAILSTGTWYYPNGNCARRGDNWYYPNGDFACRGDNWYYPNGDFACRGDNWYYPSGIRVPAEGTLIAKVLQVSETSQKEQLLAGLQQLHGQARKLVIVQLAWLANQVTKLE